MILVEDFCSIFCSFGVVLLGFRVMVWLRFFFEGIFIGSKIVDFRLFEDFIFFKIFFLCGDLIRGIINIFFLGIFILLKIKIILFLYVLERRSFKMFDLKIFFCNIVKRD